MDGGLRPGGWGAGGHRRGLARSGRAVGDGCECDRGGNGGFPCRWLLAATVWFMRAGPALSGRMFEEVGGVRQAARELAGRSPSTAAAGARPTRAAVTWEGLVIRSGDAAITNGSWPVSS